MAREIVVYADESIRRGRYFSDFYGGAAVRAEHIEEVRTSLARVAEGANLRRELKWQKVSASYLDKYIAFVNAAFDLVVADKMKVRVMFTENSLVPQNLTEYHRQNAYHILYRYFLKYGFGFEYAGQPGQLTRVRLYLDALPGTREGNAAFRGRINALEEYPPFRCAGIVFPSDQIAEVRSHDHIVLQLVDVIVGAIQFRLNDGHKVKAPGAARRGGKTIAKEKL